MIFKMMQMYTLVTFMMTQMYISTTFVLIQMYISMTFAITHLYNALISTRIDLPAFFPFAGSRLRNAIPFKRFGKRDVRCEFLARVVDFRFRL